MSNYICPKCGSSNTTENNKIPFFIKWMKKPNPHKRCLDCKNTWMDETLPPGFKIEEKFK